MYIILCTLSRIGSLKPYSPTVLVSLHVLGASWVPGSLGCSYRTQPTILGNSLESHLGTSRNYLVLSGSNAVDLNCGPYNYQRRVSGCPQSSLVGPSIVNSCCNKAHRATVFLPKPLLNSGRLCGRTPIVNRRLAQSHDDSARCHWHHLQNSPFAIAPAKGYLNPGV